MAGLFRRHDSATLHPSKSNSIDTGIRSPISAHTAWSASIGRFPGHESSSCPRHAALRQQFEKVSVKIDNPGLMLLIGPELELCADTIIFRDLGFDGISRGSRYRYCTKTE